MEVCFFCKSIHLQWKISERGVKVVSGHRLIFLNAPIFQHCKKAPYTPAVLECVKGTEGSKKLEWTLLRDF